MAEIAGFIEPVSTPRFPANSEIYSEFVLISAQFHDSDADLNNKDKGYKGNSLYGQNREFLLIQQRIF